MKIRAVVLILLVAALAALLAAKGFRTNPVPDEYTSNGAVSQSADLIKQSIQDGKPAWLLFHSKTCQPCIEMEKVFNTLKPEFEGKVTFVDINVNDPAEQELCAQYKIQYIPTTYLLEPAGNIAFDYVGVIQLDEMRAKLNALAGEG
ncbi:thioredoxin family protein [Phosphitispora fastidiosa]|uniref:thioredoxin family protein n=1 Tax=Phosphitispora fastidiosa TaxID=2837202 RepID=UPI001E512916|nr:thioredoxin family protein [Phosphitispora fastidiosa]MBU7008059.1 thioredoxin-like negative regulator of GroEL [Phosphitispora fastidiosa]